MRTDAEMKSYLSLVPISANVRRRQNRMTILCIVIAVFLVTAVFSMAEMMLRTQSDRMSAKHGTWHLELSGVSEETAAEIARREDVVSVGAELQFNPDGEENYRLNGKRVTLYGMDEPYLEQNSGGVSEGHFPQKENEILLGSNAAFVLQVQAGDTVTLRTPEGEQQFTVSGIGGVEESYYAGQYTLMDACLTRQALADLLARNGEEVPDTVYTLQFESAAQAAQAEPGLAKSCGSIKENTAVMGLAGQSSAAAMKNVYSMAIVLFVLVLLAGVLMISGSLNSNVAQRIQFFGMMRCIGMSRAQVMRFVRLEALSWCKTAIPLGLVLGTLVSWGICAVLRFGIGGEFSTTPVFQISAVGLFSGAAVGLVTVLLAAQAPARRAAKASPMAAASGSNAAAAPGRPVRLKLGKKVEAALGVHHAVASKKNWALMTASFAMSIVLALCFSVLLDFAGLLLPSLCPWQPDILFNGYGNAQVLPRSMAGQLREIPGVENVWGATGLPDYPAESADADIDHVTLCSYDTFMMESSRSMIVEGALPEADENGCEVMTIYNRNNPLKVGDTVTIHGVELTITCAFSEGMFPDDVTILCPETLFDRLAGEQDYNMMGVLLDENATEQTVAQIAGLGTDEMNVTDRRAENRSDRATYLAARVVVYGFCAILALITLFHIINSISMSVTARIRQYGAMRAVGMEDRQLFRMIAAESLTYAVSGLVVGCAVGLPLSRMLWLRFITHYFGVAWSLPLGMLGLVVVFVLAAAAAAVCAPVQRIRQMPITETLKEL